MIEKKIIFLLSIILCIFITIGCSMNPTETLILSPTSVLQTDARTEPADEATPEEPTETPEPTPEEPTKTPEPTPEEPTQPEIQKEPYESVGIWAIPPDYLEFSLNEMSDQTTDGYFSSPTCFCDDHDPLKDKLHIVFNQCNSIKETSPLFFCSYVMDKGDTGLPLDFFKASIMRLIYYAEIDPSIPAEPGKPSFSTKSQFVAKINCSDSQQGSYNTTTFYIGDRRSYYHNEKGNTLIGPEYSTNETNKIAFVLIIDFQPQFIGYDNYGRKLHRTPVYLYRYMFPDTENHKDPIEIIQDALKKTVNPGTLTDGILDQEFTEENGIYFNCQLNSKNPGFMIAGVGSKTDEGSIGVNVKIQYLIFETQYSIDNNLFAKPYGSLN